MTWDPYCTPPEVTPIARLGQLWKHQAVTHPSTNLATPCLTSVISRELVYPKCYALALLQNETVWCKTWLSGVKRHCLVPTVTVWCLPWLYCANCDFMVQNVTCLVQNLTVWSKTWPFDANTTRTEPKIISSLIKYTLFLLKPDNEKANKVLYLNQSSCT